MGQHVSLIDDEPWPLLWGVFPCNQHWLFPTKKRL